MQPSMPSSSLLSVDRLPGPGGELDDALLRAELDRLLSEPVDSAVERARTAFDRAVEPHGKRLVLFGAGNMGRRVLARLRQDGIMPLAFADNLESNQGTLVDGLPVLRPEEAAAQYGRDAAFVVTIYSYRHNFPDTRKQLLDLGCKNIVSVVPLRWKYHGTFLPYLRDDLPHKVLLHKDLIRGAFALWSDHDSRREYVAQVAWRLHADFDVLGRPESHPQYFPPDLFHLTDDEHFVDVGAYDGDTVREFLALRRENFSRLLALEPDPRSFQRLLLYLQTLPTAVGAKIAAKPFAAGNRSCRVRFAADAAPSSTLSAQGSVEVECIRLDDLLAGSRPTYIKMDIEGSEPEAIQGCQRLLREVRPVLAACVYHGPDHLWSIPLAIHRLVPDFLFFLRPHTFECWDTVCYALPPERRSSPTAVSRELR
jgi:FkbM family methyltransferase